MKETNENLPEPDFEDINDDDPTEPDYWYCMGCGHSAYPKPMGGYCPRCNSIMEEEWF